MTRATTTTTSALLCALACVSSCVLNVGLGGKRCDPSHDCISGYVCFEGACLLPPDVPAGADAGTSDPRDGGVVDSGAAGGGEGEGEGTGVVDAGNPDGGVCIKAPDGIERCNAFDDLCTGTKDLGCDNGCVDDDTFPGAFVSVCTAPLTFDDAQAVCQERGLDLAVLRDAKFNDFVMGDVATLVGDDTWIGGGDRASEGDFVWVDGTPFVFEAFDVGQPNNTNGGQDCVVTNDVRWNDVACDETHAFVCARPPSPPAGPPFCTGTPVDNDGDGVDCRTDCDDNDSSVHPGHVETCGDRIDNDCDGVVDEACSACKPVGAGGALLCERPSTWAQARAKCHDLGMQLAKIESKDLESAVNDAVAADQLDNIWIGLNDRATASSTNPVDVWDDGSPLTGFDAFGDGQPSDPATQNCFTLRDTDPLVDGGPGGGDGVYEWHDVFCDDVGGAYLCTP